MNALIAATTFLTRVRMPARDAMNDIGGAVRWFPVVGAAIGAAAGALAWMASRVQAVPPLLAALLIIALGAWVTGGIHLDGLADMADGFGGGATRADVLRIMRDSRIGAFGTIALILVIAIKGVALATLIERGTAPPLLIAAATLSRWTIVALGAWLPYARADGGLGEAVTQRRDAAGLLLATSLTLAISAIAGWWTAIYLWISAAAIITAMGRLARRRIGGVTGDVFGATVELVETGVLVVAVASR